ncbi:MAG TPA: transglutaminase-like domain-containing protein, partial [Ignavibacteriaceae bacterium]
MPFHIVVKEGATIPDTLNLITKAINVCYRSPYVVELTKRLNPTGDKYAFIKRVFDFVCNHVQYKLDTPGDEEVWTPEKTVREGIGDCKKMTVLIASILKCAGIEPVCKHVYYKNELHTHIYVIVPFPTLQNYLTVDPVNHKQWNKEVNHSKASLHFLNGTKMDLHMMGKQPSKSNFNVNWDGVSIHKAVQGVEDNIRSLAGVGCGINGSEKDKILAQSLMGDFAITGLDDDEIINGMGAIGKRKSRKNRGAQKEKRKARRQKLFHVFKAVNLAPSRVSFILLVETNIFHLAERMAKSWIHNPEGLKKVWKQFGGNPDKLKKAIIKGVARKHKDLGTQVDKINGMGRIPSVAELEAMETAGIGFPPAVAAAIAAATPIVLAVIKIIGKSKHDQDTDESSNADDIAEGVQQGAEAYADQGGGDEATEGIGYMDDADQIVSGEDYDYIDGMGKRRKKDKSARKAKRQAKKAEKKARKGKKEEGEDGEGSANDGYSDSVSEETVTKAKKKARITNADIKALSTLAEYGTRKILKGQVSVKDINDVAQKLPDDGGTEDTPRLPALATAVKDDISIPKEETPGGGGGGASSPTAGSFGLVTINSLPTFIHWLKGSSVLLMGGGMEGGIFQMISNIIVIGSFAWLTRSYTFKFTKK